MVRLALDATVQEEFRACLVRDNVCGTHKHVADWVGQGVSVDVVAPFYGTLIACVAGNLACVLAWVLT